MGSNSLCRACLISTAVIRNIEATRDTYQCPMSGVPHFYLLHDEHEVTLSAVSMPYVGRASFLQDTGWRDRFPLIRVNALCRACLISTPPSGSPVFMRVPGPVFARIFQNILKNTQNMVQKWAGTELYLFRYNFQKPSTTIIIPEIRMEATLKNMLIQASRYQSYCSDHLEFDVFLRGFQRKNRSLTAKIPSRK